MTAGCQQKMADQPRLEPLEAEPFFRDGRASRPLEFGTVPRGGVNGTFFGDGRLPDAGAPARCVRVFAGVGGGPLVALVAADSVSPVSAYTAEYPEPLTHDVLRRGRERFNVFCAPCHDRTGSGRGMVVLRGFTPPPNFHTDPSRGLQYQGVRVSLTDVPPGYVVDVIARGYGAMPDHASQVPPRDRWAIAGYVKALQFSQNVPLGRLDAEDRKALEASEGRAVP